MDTEQFFKKLKVTIITDANENDFGGNTAKDFEDGITKYHGIQILDVKYSGENNNILTFIIRVHYKRAYAAAVAFATAFENIDYSIEYI
jgi:uncharacterized protein YkuJ